MDHILFLKEVRDIAKSEMEDSMFQNHCPRLDTMRVYMLAVEALAKIDDRSVAFEN